MHNNRASRFRLIFAGALLVAWIICAVVYERIRDSGELEIYFLDVGQGDSIYIRSPSGSDMLIDGGPSVSVLRRLGEAMPWSDREIDVIVATHPDADHIGGLPPVLKRYSVGAIIESGIESKNAIDDEVERLVEEKGIERIAARAGTAVDFGDGAIFEIILPDEDVSSYADTNSASIVGLLRYGSTSFLLTGDAGKPQERRALSLYGGRLKSDVLKAGHHGSRTSSDEAFVRAADPEYAVISAGKDNRYDHPNQEVVELFERLGIPLLFTYEHGTIGFVSDGQSVRIK